MASEGVQLLPADLFHLITAELADRAIAADSQEVARPEYAALCNCILSSKYLASAGALSALYRYMRAAEFLSTHLLTMRQHRIT